MNLDRLIDLDAGQRIDFTDTKHFEFTSPMGDENGRPVRYPVHEVKQHISQGAMYASVLFSQSAHQISKINEEIIKRFNHLDRDLIPKRRYEIEILQRMYFIDGPRRTGFNFTVRITRLN